MLYETDVLIIGGGLAGLTSAIHLSKSGFKVILLERNEFPQHKVCGEYISNEVLTYLKWLNADPTPLKPAKISELLITMEGNTNLRTNLPLGGFGISRYVLDHFLFEIAKSEGCQVFIDTVTDVTFNYNQFEVSSTKDNFQAKMVLGAYGKRAMLDHKLNRNFINQKSPWLAIKAHYRGTFPDGLVALHNFEGGYCGVSKVEDDLINVCYLVDYKSFKKYKNIKDHQENVLYKNKELKSLFQASTMVFESALSISQVSFDKKDRIANHVLMIGDAAGLIHPLCGNGMSMAIHSAKLVSELSIQFLKQELTRPQMESLYHKHWQQNFRRRLNMGRLLSRILLQPILSRLLLRGLVMFPSLMNYIIRQTHGKPILITS
jgi:flavin-dependent dehydrogenase